MRAMPRPIDLAGCTMPAGRADVAELAYALDSKSSGREVMRVQLPPSAPIPFERATTPNSRSDLAWKLPHFDRFSPQSGGDGNTHGNTRRSDPRLLAGLSEACCRGRN